MPTKKKNLKEQAKLTLEKAYADACSPNFQNGQCQHDALIDYVLAGTHLTYKYVLFNALLAKATDETLNPLCLQKKSELPGAFDARTICHKVIVPFEQTTLQKVLGGSNEPFLNKPARYTDLSKDNAVRRGKDQEMLYRLCDELPLITTADIAYSDLVYFLRKLITLRNEKASLTVFSIPDAMNLATKLFAFCQGLLAENYEGEILTLVVAAIYRAIFPDENISVEVHPVNESGASSKEISDLDIYTNETILVSNELKDKEYSKNDVCHAADKVIQAGGCKMLFIEGPRGHMSTDFREAVTEEYADKNFMLSIISVFDFLRLMIPLISNIDAQNIVKYMLNTAHETKFKEETISYVNHVAEQILGLTRE